jgi:hypothetical protein
MSCRFVACTDILEETYLLRLSHKRSLGSFVSEEGMPATVCLSTGYDIPQTLDLLYFIAVFAAIKPV